MPTVMNPHLIILCGDEEDFTKLDTEQQANLNQQEDNITADLCFLYLLNL